MQILIVLFPFGPENVGAVPAKEAKNTLFGEREELDNASEFENQWLRCLFKPPAKQRRSWSYRTKPHDQMMA
jgi:hypothetical protein